MESLPKHLRIFEDLLVRSFAKFDYRNLIPKSSTRLSPEFIPRIKIRTVQTQTDSWSENTLGSRELRSEHRGLTPSFWRLLTFSDELCKLWSTCKSVNKTRNLKPIWVISFWWTFSKRLSLQFYRLLCDAFAWSCAICLPIKSSRSTAV